MTGRLNPTKNVWLHIQFTQKTVLWWGTEGEHKKNKLTHPFFFKEPDREVTETK